MPQLPETEPTKIIRPNRFFCMLREARWATRNGPVRFASMTFSNLSSVIRMRKASLEMPALDTSTSTGPWCSSTSLKARSTASLSVTSHTTPNSPSGAVGGQPQGDRQTEPPVSAGYQHRTGYECGFAAGGGDLGGGLSHPAN